MKFVSSFLLLIFLCCSCKEQQSEHLSPARMQQVLLDINIAEAYSSMVPKDTTLRITEKNLDSLAKFYQRIFKSHNISAQQFEQSMKWYTQHPEELDSIYTKLIPQVSQLEVRYE